jgi:hypothetical protein
VGGEFDGVMVEGYVSFSQARHVFSDVDLLMGGRRGEGAVAPPGFDEEGWPPPHEFDVEAGKQMYFIADVLPDCADDPAPLVLVVRSGSVDGAMVAERLPLDVRAFPGVVEEFCASPIHFAAGGGMSHADPVSGTAFEEMVLVNSASRPVTVVSREWTTPQGVHWHAASVTIPPGGRVTFRVEADGPVCSSRYPVDLGLLETADGVPIKPRVEDVNTLC